MDELVKAIVARFTSSSGASLRSATSSRIYLDTAPQDVTGTWVVFSVEDGTVSWFMGATAHNNTQDWRVVFRICTTGAITNVMTALPLLATLYDDQMLAMTGYTMILAQRDSERITRDFETEGYVGYVTYHYLTAK